jgi:hypothetical protein
MARIIGAISAEHRDAEGNMTVTTRGKEVELTPEEEERLEEAGALVDEGKTLDEWLGDKLDLYRAERGDSLAAQRLAEARSGGIVDLSSPGTGEGDPEAARIAEQIERDNLTSDDTVALAEGDPDKARAVLEAEKLATGGQPRKGVEKQLTAIIEQSE